MRYICLRCGVPYYSRRVCTVPLTLLVHAENPALSIPRFIPTSIVVPISEISAQLAAERAVPLVRPFVSMDFYTRLLSPMHFTNNCFHSSLHLCQGSCPPACIVLSVYVL